MPNDAESTVPGPPRVTIYVDDRLDPDDPVQVRADIPARHVRVAAHPRCIDEPTAEEMTRVINENIARGWGWGFTETAMAQTPPAIIFRSDPDLSHPALVVDETDGVIAVLGRAPGLTEYGAEWLTRRVGEHMDHGFWHRRAGGFR